MRQSHADCAYSPPLLQFSLLSNGSTIPADGQINPCTDPRGSNFTEPYPGPGGGTVIVRVGTYATSGVIPFTRATLGVQLTNAQGTGLGNDAAIDNISVLDVTPQLTRSFSPDIQVAGLPTRLTFTVTNTADLLAKPSWSFTDNLPSGMTIASPANIATDCRSASVMPVGSSSITARGTLDAGQASCTVSLDVTGVAGTFVNGPSNVTSSGVLPPPNTTVTFEAPNPHLKVVKTPATATAAGQLVTYSYLVTNDGNVDLTGVTLTDARTPPTGSLRSRPSCPSTTLAVGASMTCTVTYIVTQADVDHGSVDNTATAAGIPQPILGLPPATATTTATVPITAAPALSLVKTASPAKVSSAGEKVSYSFSW